MKMPIQFDTLDFARKLTEAGIPARQAEAHAAALGEIMGKAVVVPGDLLIMKQELMARHDSIRYDLLGRIDEVRYELLGRIEDVRHELIGKIEDVRRELLNKVEDVKRELLQKIEEVDHRQTAKIQVLQWMVGFSLTFQAGMFIKLMVP